MSAHPSERLASLSRAALCLGQALGALASVACDFPVDASKYQVQEASSPLLELFSDSADCLVQLENACSDPARDCEAISGCSEFTECVRAEASPAGTAYCRSLGDTSLEAQWGYENLRGCWAKEFSACTIGEDLSCQGYRPPATQPRPELLLGQRLTYLAGQKPGDTFDLSVCGLALGCAKPVAQATSDEEGLIELPIPIAEGRAGQEWNGWRVVEGAQIQRSHIRLNIPVWGDWVEVTRLVDTELLESYRAISQSEHLSIIYVQALDCQAAPMAGVRFETTNGIVSYTKGFESTREGPTDGYGAGAVWDFDSSKKIEIRVVREKDAQVVATWSGSLPVDEAMYLKLLPEPEAL